MDTTQIMQKINKFYSIIYNYINITDNNYKFKIAIFVTLFFSFFSLFYYLRKSKVIQNKAKEAFQNATLRGLYQNKNKKNYIKTNNLATKWHNLFIYSRLNYFFPFLNSEIWLFSIILFGGVGYFIASLFNRGFIFNLIIAILIIGILIFAEIYIAFHYYQKVDDNLLRFLNMLGSFSLTSGEITNVFGQVSRFMDDPLKTVLMECYYEAQTTGDSIGALQNMSDKIEHPKFKEIIKNLEISMKYSADFKNVVNNNRKILQDYLKAKQDRKAIASQNVVSMFILLLALIVALYLCGQLIDTDVWYVLFNETLGRICLAVAGLCFGFLLWKNYTINK